MPSPDTTMTNPDENYTPKNGKSNVWLAMIDEAERTYRDYQDITDGIDKQYAELRRLASIDRNREFQIYWSSMQVALPSIYSRPPVPVVVPRFADRRPLFTTTSEFLERAITTELAQEDIDSVMLELRDDLGIAARGAAWVEYYDERGEKKKREYVCPEHVDRKDFLHEPARKWKEVGWVARRSWLTYAQMKKRFIDKAKNEEDRAKMDSAVFKVLNVLKNDGGATAEQKCPVWNIWSKTEDKVVWVTEGVDITLDEDKPHLKLESFWPCPKPAYGTLQRRTLIPVPDYLQVKDQIEEINALTNRIQALSEAIRIKGFYAAGTEIGDAIESAMSILNDRQIMVPVKDWAKLTTDSQGNPVWFFPVEVVAQVVEGLIALRNEVINNIYQILGISDIMRGSTEKEETATAQEIKAQFGSVRIRDKQRELVRIARDLIVIMAEIMAEEFQQDTLYALAQMDIPTDASIRAQVKPLEEQAKEIPKQAQVEARGIMEQVKQASQDPQIQQQAQQDPQAAQQQIQQAQQQIEQIAQQAQQQVAGIMEQIQKLQAKPTIERVMKFLRDEKLRPYVLDVETDSTIQPDEQAEKAARTEFVTALGGMVQQWLPVLQTVPQSAPLVGALIKFGIAPFRAGRELEGQVDETVDALTQQGQQQQGPSPEQQLTDAKMQQMQADAANEAAKIKAQAAKDAAELQIKQQDAANAAEQRQREVDGKLQIESALADQKAKLVQREYAEKLINMRADEERKQQQHQRDMENKTMDFEHKRLSVVNTAQQGQLNKEKTEQTMAVTAEKARANKVKQTGLG